jgi:Na+/proline symporter
MRAEGSTRAEVAGLVAGFAILGGLLIWTDVFRESVKLALLLLVVFALLGVVLRAMTALVLANEAHTAKPTSATQAAPRPVELGSSGGLAASADDTPHQNGNPRIEA